MQLAGAQPRTRETNTRYQWGARSKRKTETETDLTYHTWDKTYDETMGMEQTKTKLRTAERTPNKTYTRTGWTGRGVTVTGTEAQEGPTGDTGQDKTKAGEGTRTGTKA